MKLLLSLFTLSALMKPPGALAALIPPEELAARFQPLIHFHSQETIFPQDPEEFLAATGLRAGRFTAPLQKTANILDSKSPLFWRARPTANNATVIEYWYFAPYSEANLFGFGSHWGDWEGVAAIVSAGTTPKLLAVYAAAHEWGSWHCAAQLSPQVEIFAGLGSHASYALNNGVVAWPRLDRLDRGQAWKGALRQLEAQPFYSYKGRWGSSQPLTLSFAPLAPSETKRLPRGSTASVDREIANVVKSCQVPTAKLAKMNASSGSL